MPRLATAFDRSFEGQTILGALKRSDAPIIVAAIAVAVSRIATLPGGFWEAAEVRFAKALLTFDPARLQPHPPGYPLYVALGRVFHVFITDEFIALVTLSVVASVLAALLIGRAGAALFGSAWTGAAAAIVVLLSPAMLVFGPLPNAESVSLALIAATFAALIERRGDPFALLAAASIGARPQTAPAMIVALVIGLTVIEKRPRAIVIFIAALAVCFVPVFEAGTPLDVDAAFRPDLLLRFTAHPWGGKFLSFPLLAVAAAGAVVAWRRYLSGPLIAIVTFGLVHTAMSLLFASALDGVRPVIPALITVGFLAVAAFARWPVIAALLASAFAVASFLYTWPLIAARRATSPAAKAMGTARGFVIADPDLAPFSDHALTPERFDELVRRNPIRLALVMHGRSETPGARTFKWPDSDAYGKITPEHFRVVSVIPLPASRRYAARSGVYPYESSPDRGEWRWLRKRAEIEVGGSRAVLRLRLPPDAPIESNRVRIGEATAVVPRGAAIEVEVPHSGRLVIEAERSFTARDGRELSVQLVSVSSRA